MNQNVVWVHSYVPEHRTLLTVFAGLKHAETGFYFLMNFNQNLLKILTFLVF